MIGEDIRQPKKLTYLPGVDGMRGLWCILIIINHWRLTLPFSPLGWQVLQGFFVISGFLIARILLYQRDKHDSFKSYIKSFYIQRSLRIFPLYFIYLLVMFIIRWLFVGSEFVSMYTEELGKLWPYYLTYTANLKVLADTHVLDTPFFSHLWSLSLEEQFYLIMPFLIYFFRGRSLKIVLLALIILPNFARAFAFPYMANHTDHSLVWQTMFVFRNLPFNCDAFALGVALAAYRFDWIKHPLRWFYALSVVYIGFSIYNYQFANDYLNLILPNLGDHTNAGLLHGGETEGKMNLLLYLRMMGSHILLPMKGQHLYIMPLVNIITFLSVITAVRGNTMWRMVYESKVMIEVGKVIYGIYVLHHGFMVIYMKASAKVLSVVGLKGNMLLDIPLFIVYFVILYYVSKLTYIYIEGPFLKLKKRFR